MLICYHFPQFLGLSLINPSLLRDDVIKRLANQWVPEPIHGAWRKTLLSSPERERADQLPLWEQYDEGANPLYWTEVMLFNFTLEIVAIQLTLPRKMSCNYWAGKSSFPLWDHFMLISTSSVVRIKHVTFRLCHICHIYPPIRNEYTVGIHSSNLRRAEPFK